MSQNMKEAQHEEETQMGQKEIEEQQRKSCLITLRLER